MQERKIYKTLRISFNQEMKLFPSWKIEGIDNLKEKVIMRFDMTWEKDDFDLEYRDKETNENLMLKDVPGLERIDMGVIQMLINNKITLIVKKREFTQVKAQIKMKLENQESFYEKQSLNAKHYAQCDHCMQFPIIGIRYKCLICKNFDLCSQCYLKLQQKAQQKCHPYIKIRQPIQKIDSIEVSFDDNEMMKMNFSCEKFNEIKQHSESKFQKEIDQGFLPQKYVAGRNFVEKLFDETTSKRQSCQFNKQYAPVFY